MEEKLNQVIDSIDSCALIFNSIFNSYDSKINFLEMCNENPFFLDSDEKYKKVKECIAVLVKNAEEQSNRKQQQQKLMPIITKLSENLSEDDISKFFKGDEISFSLFCLMHIAFKYDVSLNDHGQNFHKYIIEGLDKYSIMLIKNNKGTHNEK